MACEMLWWWRGEMAAGKTEKLRIRGENGTGGKKKRKKLHENW